MTQLDLLASRQARDSGMKLATHTYGAENWLREARAVAEMLIGEDGETTIDQVLKLCPRPSTVGPNVTGSVFKGKRFHCIGFTQTAQIQGHARAIRRWVLSE